jgi:hypothetical protein
MRMGPKSTSSRLRKHESLFRITVRCTLRRVAATFDIPVQSRGHAFRTTSEATFPAVEGECKLFFQRSNESALTTAGYDNEVGDTVHFPRTATFLRVFFKSCHSCPTATTATSVALINTPTPYQKTDSNTQQPRVRKFYGSKQLSPNSIRTRESETSNFPLLVRSAPSRRRTRHRDFAGERS